MNPSNADCDRIRKLLDAGADINGKFGDYDNTLLHIAIQERNIDSIVLLIERGADVTISNKHRDTPLHYAVWFSGMTTTIIKLLLAAGSMVNAKNNNGNTPLIVLRTNQSDDDWEEKVLIMLTAGAHIDAQNLDGTTILHYSVVNNKINRVRFLLDHGASTTDIIIKDGWNILDLATDDAIKTLLLEHIASQNVKNAGRRK